MEIYNIKVDALFKWDDMWIKFHGVWVGAPWFLQEDYSKYIRPFPSHISLLLIYMEYFLATKTILS